MSDNTKDVTKRAASVVKKASDRSLAADEVQVSTGVIFGVKRVPPLVLTDIRREFKEPPIPTWYNKDTGRREANPDDPEYIKANNEYMVNMSMAVVDIMILMGTEVKYVPSNLPSPDSQAWDSELRAILLARGWSRSEIAELSADEKYVFWVKYRAAVDNDMDDDNNDIGKITTAIGRLSGVAEEDVKDAIDTFRDNN